MISDEWSMSYFRELRAYLSDSKIEVFAAHNFTDQLRRELEPDASQDLYDSALEDRRRFVGHSDVVPPVLLDNNVLFRIEQALAQHAVVQFCTEPNRCPNDQPSSLRNSESDEIECKWNFLDNLMHY